MLLIISLIVIIYLLNLVNNQKILLSKYTRPDNNLLSMMVENDQGEYEESKNNEFPQEGYILDIKRSACENGVGSGYIQIYGSSHCDTIVDENHFSVRPVFFLNTNVLFPNGEGTKNKPYRIG